MEDERIITTRELSSDNFEKTIRPTHFDEYIGQEEVKNNMMVFVKIWIEQNACFTRNMT